MNNEIKKVLFIVNKYSGKGFHASHEKSILEACQKYGVEGVIEITQAPGHATRLAQAAIGAFEKVIAVGGDGTVNEVAQALFHSHMPMGIIPKGSGNGLARHLRIPVKITDALECLFTSEIIALDSFRMNGRLSLNVSGIGFDGHIATLFAREKKRGFQGYAKLALNEFIQFPEFEFELAINGNVIKNKAFVIAIANSSQYGNNALIAPDASVCDQLLNITILKKMPAYRLDFVYSLFHGTIKESAYCEVLEARDFTIAFPLPLPFHIDGEPAGYAEHFAIEMIPASIKMLAPCNIIRP